MRLDAPPSPAPPAVLPPPADDFRDHPRWRLAAFLLCSLLGHLVCFYLFQVAYPPAAPPPPAPVTIYLPAPGTPEAAQVAAWAEAADPARLALPPLPPPARVLEAAGANEYEPSFGGKVPDSSFKLQEREKDQEEQKGGR